jgi:hypothetical protein
VADGEPHRFVGPQEDDPYAAWSPDGTTIAVRAACALYRVPATGGQAERIGPGVVQA